MQAALAFAAATVEYTRGLDSAAVIQHSGWDWHRFTAWVRRHPEYAPLQAELEALTCAC
ncbi:hypothetical protein [Nocardia sp. NPDC056000]|uniref:hypothetical protein n=1 Tax=Nocardia sp. NPDC056000 TaxID=3345674 RepID=UPI0035E30D22